jgi:hypothetical protein
MSRQNIVLCLLLATLALALSQLPHSVARANNKKCEIVTERTCDFKGNCKDKTYETCSGLSGQRNPVNPNTQPPKATAGKLQQPKSSGLNQAGKQ